MEPEENQQEIDQPGTSAGTGSQETSESSDNDIVIVDKVHKKGKKSWVWEFCGVPKIKGVLQESKTICKLCFKDGRKALLMPYTGNTSTMSYHLNAVHYTEVHGPATKKGE